MTTPNVPPQPEAPQDPYQHWEVPADQAQQAPAPEGYSTQQQTPYGAAPQYQQYQQGAPMYGQVYYSQKSKIVAGLLGIFLGSLGIHNFYLGKTTRAIVQIVLTFLTLGFAGIWGFVEGILIIASNYGSPWHKDANGVELRD